MTPELWALVFLYRCAVSALPPHTIPLPSRSVCERVLATVREDEALDRHQLELQCVPATQARTAAPVVLCYEVP